MTPPFLYSVEREYPVAIKQLWKAWVNPLDLESWCHGTEHESIKGATTSDLSIGGLWSCGIFVPSHNFSAYFFGRYTEIIENELLEHTMHYTDSPEEFNAKDFSSASHHVVIRFESRGEKSWVNFSSLESYQMARNCRQRLEWKAISIALASS